MRISAAFHTDHSSQAVRQLTASLYEIPQIMSLTLFERIPIDQLEAVELRPVGANSRLSVKISLLKGVSWRGDEIRTRGTGFETYSV